MQGHDSAGMAAVVRRPHGGCARFPVENWTGARHWAAVQLFNKNGAVGSGCGAVFHTDTQGALSREHIKCSQRMAPVPDPAVPFLFSSCRRKPTAERPSNFPPATGYSRRGACEQPQPSRQNHAPAPPAAPPPAPDHPSPPAPNQNSSTTSPVHEAVPDPHFGHDITGMVGVFFDFAADVGHKDTQGLVFPEFTVAPDFVLDIGVGQNFAGIFD